MLPLTHSEAKLSFSFCSPFWSISLVKSFMKLYLPLKQDRIANFMPLFFFLKKEILLQSEALKGGHEEASPGFFSL